MVTNRPDRACPKCGSPESRPLSYGFPSFEAFDAIDRGEIALGGCCIEAAMPLRECRACRYHYGDGPAVVDADGYDDRVRPRLSARFEKAASYALGLHQRQIRKGTTIPYASHLLSVAAIVMEAGGTEDECIAALLHDGPEDCGGRATLAAIREKFGDIVADIVEHCSDTFKAPKPDWETRKRRHAKALGKADASTLLVSAADKLHNARATLLDVRYGDSASVWARFSAPKEKTLENYDRLIDAYGRGVADPRRDRIVAELRRMIEELRAL